MGHCIDAPDFDPNLDLLDLDRGWREKRRSWGGPHGEVPSVCEWEPAL